MTVQFVIDETVEPIRVGNSTIRSVSGPAPGYYKIQWRGWPDEKFVLAYSASRSLKDEITECRKNDPDFVLDEILSNEGELLTYADGFMDMDVLFAQSRVKVKKEEKRKRLENLNQSTQEE